MHPLFLSARLFDGHPYRTVRSRGVGAHFIYVDGAMKKTEAGEDYLAINPLGLVPALVLDDGTLLTENAAILGYLADRYLAGRGRGPRARRQQWIGFVNSELHTGAFGDPQFAVERRGKHPWSAPGTSARFAYLGDRAG